MVRLARRKRDGISRAVVVDGWSGTAEEGTMLDDPS